MLEEFNISNQQAKDFAKAVYPNIAQFINSHREGYKSFLESKKSHHGNSDEDELSEIK